MNATNTVETLELNAEIAAELAQETQVESLSIAELDMIGGGTTVASWY